jgi:uncharacterized protein (DUF1499 family)
VYSYVLSGTGMAGISVDEDAAYDDCSVYRHLTVQSSIFGFLDDFWVCVREGACVDGTTGWQFIAQGQLRLGGGDIGQNFRHVEEFQNGVRVAALSANVLPIEC